MAEKDTIFSSEVKHGGIFSFRDFYTFCHEWLINETGLEMQEKKYVEKLKGDAKDIEIEWEGSKKLTDYFKFETKITIKAEGIKKVQIQQGGAKVDTNKGAVKIKMKGILVRDYQGRFETTGFNKFLRSIYEKWVIHSRISAYENKIIGDCDEFLTQVKAYLDLEGKK